MGEKLSFRYSKLGKKLGGINPIFQVPGRNTKDHLYYQYYRGSASAIPESYENKDHVSFRQFIRKNAIFSIYERDEKVDSEV